MVAVVLGVVLVGTIFLLGVLLGMRATDAVCRRRARVRARGLGR